MDLFLGLDLSTQQLKLSLIDANLNSVLEEAVNFQDELPQYKTTHGVFKRKIDPLRENGKIITAGGEEVVAPVKLWLHALDLLLSKVPSQLIRRVKAISGAGQQHSSVWWSDKATAMLEHLDPKSDLTQLCPEAFTLHECPTWQDSTTHAECEFLERAVGGPDRLADITGSRGHDRFTGTQIKRRRTIQPDIYKATDRISLVSSFLPSLFLGKIAPMDCADACGMNLYDIREKKWNSALLDCASRTNRVDVGLEESTNEGEDLARKLGDVELNSAVNLGPIHSYFVKKYSFDPSCMITTFTGDNPATMLSTTVLDGDCIHSLGTSDTVLLSTTAYVPNIDSHLFIHPAYQGSEMYMAMLCYKNGSLSREWVRDQYANGSWDMYTKHLDTLKPDPTAIGFYFLQREIIPKIPAGIYRFKNAKEIQDDFDPTGVNARAILESQFISARVRSRSLMKDKPSRVIAVGGASSNPAILNILASVFDAPVHKLGDTQTNSCSIGGARKALWAFENTKTPIAFEKLISQRLQTADSRLVASPVFANAQLYDSEVIPVWKKSEAALIKAYGMQ